MSVERPLAIVDVSVVDTLTGALAVSRDVIVQGGRIEQVVPTGGFLPTEARILPGNGRWLVPGYIDSHAHAATRADPVGELEAMLAQGVTGYRQMAGSDRLLRARAQALLPGPPLAPALLATCGTVLTAANAGTPQHAAAEVRRQEGLGADFVKITAVPESCYPALQDAADALGIPVAGHIPGLAVRESARMRVIEHLGAGLALPLAVSRAAGSILAGLPESAVSSVREGARGPGPVGAVLARLGAGGAGDEERPTPALADAIRRAVGTADEQRMHDLAGLYRHMGTWHCPTLARQAARAHDGTAGRRSAAIPESTRAALTELLDWQRRFVAVLAREGVGLLAGSGSESGPDSGGVHREFAELAAAGLEPLRILQMATLDPARLLGIEGGGRVAPGSPADLVLLDADPLVDAAHLARIATVVRDGEIVAAPAPVPSSI